jgi:hypothetical protein
MNVYNVEVYEDGVKQLQYFEKEIPELYRILYRDAELAKDRKSQDECFSCYFQFKVFDRSNI